MGDSYVVRASHKLMGAATNGRIRNGNGIDHNLLKKLTPTNGHKQILINLLPDNNVDPNECDEVEKKMKHTTESVQSTSNTRGEGEAGGTLSAELACDDKEGSAKFSTAVQEGNIVVLQELFRSNLFYLIQFPVHPLIVIAALGSSKAVEYVCSLSSAAFKWNAKRDIPVGVFEGLLDGMKDRNATPLYVATFLKKKVTVGSLIEYSDEQNIAYCINNIQLSKSMESVYMAEVGKRLKSEHSELKPVVIPGHQKEANGTWTRVFIVYSPNVVHATNHKRDGIGLVMIRNPYRVDEEAVTVNGKEVDGDISELDMKRAKIAIESHSQTLWRNHSNLNIISVCSVRSKLKGDKLEKCLCVVLYCSTKGVVPLGEREFPTRLAVGEDDYIDIDVREGYFEYGGYETRPSTHHHKELKMGCNIGALTLEEKHGGGTLGPFVNYNGKMGFLTCAHVLFDISQEHYVDFTYEGFNRLDVVQPATGASVPSQDSCGFVQRAIFNPRMDTSIDVAVVTISDEARRPINGRFANDHSYKYKQAGFGELPAYNDGAILPDIQHFGTSNMVVKFGSQTHLTKGYLIVEKLQVRPLSTALGLPHMAEEICVNNQYEVKGVSSGIPFVQPGDSGSAVFMLKGTSLRCIGLAIGRTSHGTAVVTPIKAILAALGSDATIELQRFDE